MTPKAKRPRTDAFDPATAQVTACTGKHRYAPRGEARRVIAARQKEAHLRHCPHKEAKRQRASLTTYRCRQCQGWHIASGDRR